MLHLVLEYPAMDGEFPPFTRQNPGSTIDFMAEPGPANSPTRTGLILVRGAPWQAIDAFVADLSRRRAPVTTLRREPASGLWFGRATFNVASMTAPGTKVITGLLGMIGPPWAHVEHGVVHLRARLKDATQAEDVLHLAEEGLRAAGIESQAVIQEVAPKDHSVWESLIQHGIGMSL